MFSRWDARKQQLRCRQKSVLHTRKPMDQVFRGRKTVKCLGKDPHELVSLKTMQVSKNGKFIMSDHNHITTETARGLENLMNSSKNFLLKLVYMNVQSNVPSIMSGFLCLNNFAICYCSREFT